MPDGYLKAVARRTRDTYYQHVCRLEWTRSYRRQVVTNEVWHQRVGCYLSPMLSDAILMNGRIPAGLDEIYPRGASRRGASTHNDWHFGNEK